MQSARTDSLLNYAHQLDASASKAPGVPLVYKIEAGDTLGQIILDNYGAAPGSERYRQAEAQILLFNREVTDPNRIRMGQVLRLLPVTPAGSCPAPEGWSAQQIATLPVSRTRHYLEPADPNYVERIGRHIPTDPAEREAFRAMAWLEQNYNWLAQPAGVGVSSLGLLAGPGNAALLQEVGAVYRQYQQGNLTKGQYDYRRRQALKNFAKKMGPAERLLIGGRANEVIRISRGAGVPATAKIDAAAARLGKLSKYAARGTVILAGASAYVGCRQIAATGDRQEKSEILVETVTSTGIGLIAGVAVTAFLISNPVGWAVALGISAAAAAASTGVGGGLRHAYNRWGNEIDLVGMSGVDKVCN